MITVLLLGATGAGLHIRVDGDGYFRFACGTQAVYSADVTLSTSSGVLASPDGYPLLPQIHVPVSGHGVEIGMDGTVNVSGKPVGHIVLASFGRAQLQKMGTYWTSTNRSAIGYPGDGIFGVIKVVNGPSAPAVVSHHATPQSMQPTIDIALKSEVNGDHILLKDIAQIEGAGAEAQQIGETDLGTTPIYGAERGISRIFVLAKLRNEGVNTDRYEIVCPTGATVIRKGQSVSGDTMIAAAAKAVKDQFGVDFDMKSERSLPDVMVPAGELTINTIQAIQTSDGATVNLELDVDGKTATRRTIYLVPTVPIPQVRTGDPVKIRMVKNGATVEIAGKCRSTAKVGTSITVETETGATFSGILRSASLVEVNL